MEIFKQLVYNDENTQIMSCEFENADTIPSKQLDIRVFDETETQHAFECHPN